MRDIREVLKTAGMDFKDVTSVTVYIASFDDFAKFNAILPRDVPGRSARARNRPSGGVERWRPRRAADDRHQAGELNRTLARQTATHEQQLQIAWELFAAERANSRRW